MYEYIELEGDAGFVIRARRLDSLFSKASEALYNIMVDISKVHPVEERFVEVSSESLDILLHHWLEELLFLTDTENLVFSKFNVEVCKEEILKARGKVLGEPIDPVKHDLRVAVKAITYHRLYLKKRNDGTWEAGVIVDL